MAVDPQQRGDARERLNQHRHGEPDRGGEHPRVVGVQRGREAAALPIRVPKMAGRANRDAWLRRRSPITIWLISSAR
jgi:hypothetical protein